MSVRFLRTMLTALLMAPGRGNAQTSPTLKPLIATLAWYRGGVLLVEAPPAWKTRLAVPDLGDLLEDTFVEARPISDPGLLKLGIARPGVYLVTPTGKVLASWHGAPPADLGDAFRAAGWKSPTDDLRVFVQAHPDRVDARWSLVARLEEQLKQHPVPKTYQAYAEALDLLLRSGHWMEARSPLRGLEPTLPEGVTAHPLVDLAKTHWEAVAEVVRRAPAAKKKPLEKRVG